MLLSQGEPHMQGTSPPTLSHSSLSPSALPHCSASPRQAPPCPLTNRHCQLQLLDWKFDTHPCAQVATAWNKGAHLSRFLK